jgi:hypothetical protein
MLPRCMGGGQQLTGAPESVLHYRPASAAGILPAAATGVPAGKARPSAAHASRQALLHICGCTCLSCLVSAAPSAA